MQKVAIITCWMGEYPKYFPLWLKSCESNKHIDWLLVAANVPKENLPDNVHFVNLSLEDIKKRVSTQLGMEASGLTSPYKLCDFRPLYGLIFKEELAGYTHWGHCDIDLVWGDFSHFLTDELLEKYDKIYTKGHLGIYKNNDAVNNRCFDKNGLFSLDEIVSKPNFYAFDELTGMERIYKKSGYDYCADAPYIDVSVRYESSFLLNRSEENYPHQAYYWEHGKIYRVYEAESGDIAKDEWLYLHFQKKCPENLISNVSDVKSFWISPKGFIAREADSPVSLQDILQMNPPLSEKQAKKEKQLYFKKKAKQFFKKSWKDKCIHIKQKLSKVF